MPVGGTQSYFLRGRKPQEEEASVEEALAKLQGFWKDHGSLKVHDMGNLVVTLRIGSEDVTFEITDPAVLDAYVDLGPAPILALIRKELGLGEEVGDEVLARMAGRVEVDTFRDPADPGAWRPGLQYHEGVPYGAPPASAEIPQAIPRLIGELLREEDEGRAPGRRRSKLATDLLGSAVEHGRKEGWTDAEIARKYSVPRTTVRDTRYRQERREKVVAVLGARKAGRPLTRPQKDLVLDEVKRQGGNASAAARELGLPTRTVREIRQRAVAQAAAPRAGISGGRHKPAVRAQVLAGVRGGLTATEAGRAVGVAGRTARGWIRAEKIKSRK